MHIITAPKVTVVARPAFEEAAHLPCEWTDELEGSEGERLAEYAGRICYMSYQNPARRTTGEYLQNILARGHGSVLEHAVYVLLIEGISRSCSHELVRHRAGFGYSQLSQRYVDASDTAFVVPPALEGDEVALSIWRGQCLRALAAYRQLQDRNMERFAYIENKTERLKVARESARSVLPNATETKIVVSGNARAWRTMLELRCGEGAEREIRRLALRILEVLQGESPIVFEDFKLYEAGDHQLAAKPAFHKV